MARGWGRPTCDARNKPCWTVRWGPKRSGRCRLGAVLAFDARLSNPTSALFFRLQYGEEEVCSDRLDTDFPDIDLSQLDTSDFDSVNCLSELQWCNDQPADASPASIHYSTADELFEVRPSEAPVPEETCLLLFGHQGPPKLVAKTQKNDWLWEKQLLVFA